MAIRNQFLTIVLLSLVLQLSGAATAKGSEFVVLGDMPYGKDQIGTLKYIGSKIRARGFPFVVHYGDVKAGDGVCSDAVLRERQQVIYGLMEGRVFFTPGDNDWTDCDRAAAGGFDELERLSRLREIFFAPGDLPAEPDWRIARQEPDYPENARWRREDVVFVTLHIVGSDNGRQEIEHSDVQEALAAVAERDRANLVWLDAAFGAAVKEGEEAAALVIFMQADPDEIWDRSHRGRPCDAQEPQACNPYLTFLESLTAQADAFDKPVLLVHGSTNSFCLDTGFGGWRARKLWRLNGPGDFVTVDAAVVKVDPEARIPFQVHGLLSGDSPPDCVGR